MNEIKGYEKYYLNILLTYLDIEPEKIIFTESPDFKIIVNKQKIGIELTRIFNETGNPPLQAIEGDYNKITNYVNQKLLKTKLPPLEVYLLFSQNPIPRLKSKKEIGNKIFKLIKRNVPDKNKYIAIKNDFENDDIIPYELSNINIANFPVLEKHFVNTSSFGWVNKVFSDLIQSIIKKKEIKLRKYDKTCIKFWLLIHTGGYSGASMFEPSNETISHNYSSKFNKVFFMDNFEKKVYSLKIN
ncbi:MAG: hypothetical protein IIA48_04135 [Bacteroidetes bacterium]|nr:hypothetical protein [Bacteroidota bacterium]